MPIKKFFAEAPTKVVIELTRDEVEAILDALSDRDAKLHDAYQRTHGDTELCCFAFGMIEIAWHHVGMVSAKFSEAYAVMNGRKKYKKKGPRTNGRKKVHADNDKRTK